MAIMSKTPNAPATEKQIEYVTSLIGKRKREEIMRRRDELTPALDRAQAIEDEAQRVRAVAFAQGKIDSSHEVEALFGAITIPADMNQARASRWIGLLDNDNLTILGKLIDEPKIAAGLGIAELVSEALYERYTGRKSA